MTKKVKNPFLTRGYYGPDFFCDREFEVKTIYEALENGRNITLFGRRKLGKTALIKHVFHLNSKEHIYIWIDLLPTQNFEGFINTFANSIFRKLAEKQSTGRKFIEGLKSLRPVISYDDISGIPQLKLDITDPKELKMGFEGLLNFLKTLKKSIVIAFDEFQQILNYPETQTEAYLRTIMQSIPEITFIFSGSDQHMLNAMFTGTDRPFYQMSQMMKLKPIATEEYRTFIKYHFKKGKKNIKSDHIDYILNWTNGITYYVQFVCNRLYSMGKSNIGFKDIQRIMIEILQEFEDNYYVFRNMLTRKQWRVLSAIACEERVQNIYGKIFMSKYNFFSTSSVKRAMDSLEKNNLIYKTLDKGIVEYQLQDLFLSKWIKKMEENS